MSHRILYKKVPAPKQENLAPIPLTDETIIHRKQKIMDRMAERKLDKLIVYCDVEHSFNFNYLTGFFSRFEEALLIMDKSGDTVLILGNENLNKASKSRIPCRAVHLSLFSLPDQPQRDDKTFVQLLGEAGLEKGLHTGVAGWKIFTSPIENTGEMFDLPHFIIKALETVAGKENLVNRTDIFTGEKGARCTNNANEIAHYEFGASLASDNMLSAMDLLTEGVSEMELATRLVKGGQHPNIVTIAAAGERFIKANMFPTDRKVKRGVPVALTVGFAGGSSSRSGFAIENASQLPPGNEKWLENMAMPYFSACAHWLENIKPGMTGGELFRLVDTVLPRTEYGWSLCPGHLTAEEEWMCSPVYENSTELLQSGMIFQLDIIPSVKGLNGVSAETTVVLADEKLKEEIRAQYPQMWQRMENRRQYITDVLGINISPDVLPLCSTVGYMRPFMLDKEKALTVEK